MFRIAPQWQGPQVSISIFNKQYLPNKYGEVYIGINKNAIPGIYIATLVEYGRGVQLSRDFEQIEVINKNFPKRKKKPFKPTPIWRHERELINEAFGYGNCSEKYFDGLFIRPLDLVFVDKNRTIGGVTPQGSFGDGHDGVDLITLDTKTKKHQQQVKAINSGKVVLIAINFSTDGNMIIIDHGSCIFSVYMHLSDIQVSGGDMVKTDNIIGLSGNTGRARKSGPHLHFAVKLRDKDKIRDTYVDPLRFIDTINSVLTKGYR